MEIFPTWVLHLSFAALNEAFYYGCELAMKNFDIKAEFFISSSFRLNKLFQFSTNSAKWVLYLLKLAYISAELEPYLAEIMSEISLMNIYQDLYLIQ